MGWKDVNNTTNNGGDEHAKLEYCKPTPAGTKIRVLGDEPLSAWTHWVQSANHGKGTTVICLGKNCPVCAANRAAKAAKLKTMPYGNQQQFFLAVYNHDTQRVEALVKGRTVFKPLSDLLEDEDYGDLRGYDIKVKLSDDGKSCTCIPQTKSKFQINVGELPDLSDMVKPLTIEQVEALMNGASIAELFGENNEESADETQDEESDVDFRTK